LCALETLNFNFIDFADESAYALAYALGQNKSVKSLRFGERGITTKGMKAFLKLICDSSSPNRIYLSNHTLRDISGLRYTRARASSIRTSILGWLKMNKDCQTPNLAAKAKIMHFFPDLDMVPLFQWNLKFLPLVKSWFQKTTSSNEEFAASIRNRELSAVYQFVRGLPVLVVSAEEEERRLMQITK
jgi:hypothetical protein